MMTGDTLSVSRLNFSHHRISVQSLSDGRRSRTSRKLLKERKPDACTPAVQRDAQPAWVWGTEEVLVTRKRNVKARPVQLPLRSGHPARSPCRVRVVY